MPRSLVLLALFLLVLSPSPASAAENPDGQAVYQQACAACHNSGVAGAPELGNSQAWQKRIEKGMETLVRHAIEGFQGEAGNMPAKGGNPSLSDAEVEAAVKYMVEQSR